MIRLDMDIKMPESCARCPFTSDYTWCRAIPDDKRFDDEFDCVEGRADWCPLKEIDDDEGYMC